MSSIIRRSPSTLNRLIASASTVTSSPPTTGKTGALTSLQLAQKTAYLQPTSQQISDVQTGVIGNYAQFGANITVEQLKSQYVPLNAIGVAESKYNINLQTQGEINPTGRSITAKDIPGNQLAGSFGMLGTGIASNIRLAAAQTGADIPSLITKTLQGMGVSTAFAYEGTNYNPTLSYFKVLAAEERSAAYKAGITNPIAAGIGVYNPKMTLPKSVAYKPGYKETPSIPIRGYWS